MTWHIVSFGLTVVIGFWATKFTVTDQFHTMIVPDNGNKLGL